METKEKVNNGANGAAVKGANPVTEENKTQKFVAGNPVNKDSTKPGEAAQPAPKAEPVKGAEQPKAQPAATAAAEPKKLVLNLEGTLKFIEEKHRLMKQRTKLQDTIKNLDAFDVELRDEADTTDTNYYNGCVLTIQDDKRNTFETKNPTIIWTVAQLVNNMCVEKLAEIEAGIVLPS